MVFQVSPGQVYDAVPTCLARRCWTASEDSRRHEAGIDASIVTVGDAHDNSLAESINGLYKTELIKPRRPWRNANHVEAETATYLDWFNNRRLYEYCGDMPPVKLEQIFYGALSINEVA